MQMDESCTDFDASDWANVRGRSYLDLTLVSPQELDPEARVKQVQQLRRAIYGTHIPAPFPTRVRTCLEISSKFPDSADKVGMIELGSSRIAVCAETAGSFLGIKANSMNTNFRQHAFKYLGKVRMTPGMPEILQRVDWPRWSVWENTLIDFTQHSTNDEITALTKWARRQRPQKYFSANPMPLKLYETGRLE
jgi:hypothetical protein